MSDLAREIEEVMAAQELPRLSDFDRMVLLSVFGVAKSRMEQGRTTTPIHQADVARHMGVDPRRVSEAVGRLRSQSLVKGRFDLSLSQMGYRVVDAESRPLPGSG